MPSNLNWKFNIIWVISHFPMLILHTISSLVKILKLPTLPLLSSGELAYSVTEKFAVIRREVPHILTIIHSLTSIFPHILYIPTLYYRSTIHASILSHINKSRVQERLVLIYALLVIASHLFQTSFQQFSFLFLTLLFFSTILDHVLQPANMSLFHLFLKNNPSCTLSSRYHPISHLPFAAKLLEFSILAISNSFSSILSSTYSHQAFTLITSY